jgi:branched-subunit amino acid ABC-type transport system permease component
VPDSSVLLSIAVIGISEGCVLFIAALALQIAYYATDSYHVDLLAITVLAPVLFASQGTKTVLSALIVVAVSLLTATGLKALIQTPARRRGAQSTTLLVLSLSSFQILLILTGALFSHKAHSWPYETRAVIHLGASSAITNVQIYIIASTMPLVAILLAAARRTKVVALLKALRENPLMLAAYGYDPPRLALTFTCAAALFAAISGYGLLLRDSVSTSSAYSLFLLTFGTILLARHLSIVELLGIALSISLLINSAVFLAGSKYRLGLSSVILVIGCVTTALSQNKGRKYE